MTGQINADGDGYDITKTYTSGDLSSVDAIGGQAAQFYIDSAEVPTDANYFFSEFDYTSNIGQTGTGRLGAAFVASNQLQGPE